MSVNMGVRPLSTATTELLISVSEKAKRKREKGAKKTSKNHPLPLFIRPSAQAFVPK